MIYVDTDELPKGSTSSTLAYKCPTTHDSFSLGGGRDSYDGVAKPIVQCNFQSLGLYVTGGKSMIEAAKATGDDKSLWLPVFVQYTMLWLVGNGRMAETIVKLIDNAYEEGKNDGRECLQRDLRRLLGV